MTTPLPNPQDRSVNRSRDCVSEVKTDGNTSMLFSGVRARLAQHLDPSVSRVEDLGVQRCLGFRSFGLGSRSSCGREGHHKDEGEAGDRCFHRSILACPHDSPESSFRPKAADRIRLRDGNPSADATFVHIPVVWLGLQVLVMAVFLAIVRWLTPDLSGPMSTIIFVVGLVLIALVAYRLRRSLIAREARKPD